MTAKSEALVAALKREREQLAGRTDPNGVRRLGEVDAAIARASEGSDARDEAPRSRGRGPQRTADAS